MRCNIDLIKTDKCSVEEIYEGIVRTLDIKSIAIILKEDLVLKLKCNIVKKSNYLDFDRKKVEEAILELYKTSDKLKVSINKLWEIESLSFKVRTDSLSVDKIRRLTDKENEVGALLKCAVLLWLRKEEEYNALGDKVYEKYLLKKNPVDVSTNKEGGKNMEGNVLDMSLGQLLELSRGDCEESEIFEELEAKIDNNSEEIKKLCQQMKLTLEFNKDIKKLLNSVNEQLKVLSKDMLNKEQDINVKVSALSKEVKAMNADLKQQQEANDKSMQNYNKYVSTVNTNLKNVLELVKNENTNLDTQEKTLNIIKNEVQELKLKVVANKEKNNSKVEKDKNVETSLEVKTFALDKVKKGDGVVDNIDFDIEMEIEEKLGKANAESRNVIEGAFQEGFRERLQDKREVKIEPRVDNIEDSGLDGLLEELLKD